MTTLIIALAGSAGFSSTDELVFTGVVLFFGLLKALFLPIFTFRDPPLWMVWLQPVIVAMGLIRCHVWLRERRTRLWRRLLLYVITYCGSMFVTNMAGEARGVFDLADELIDQAMLIGEGRGYPADTRP